MILHRDGRPGGRSHDFQATRRPDPENIYQAKRAGLRGRMVSTWHVREADVDALLDGWDAEAVARGIARGDPRYRTEGEPWLRDKSGVSGDP